MGKMGTFEKYGLRPPVPQPLYSSGMCIRCYI